MKKNVAILVGVVLILVPAIAESELLSEEVELPHEKDIKIESTDDGDTYRFSAPVSVKRGQTYVEEVKTVEITIKPEEPRPYEDKEKFVTDKDHFLRVFVSFVFQDRGENIKGYLYFEDCDGSKDRLFWEYADRGTGSRRQTFGNDNPLTESNKYFEVTVTLKDKTISNHSYTPGPTHDALCELSPGCYLYYMDSLTLGLTIDYSRNQKNVMLQHALEHERKGYEFFNAGDYENAKIEYQNAKDIYDQLGNTEKATHVENQIRQSDEKIGKPETETKTRVRNVLFYIAVSIAATVGVGVVYKLIGKEKLKERPVTVAEERPIPEERPVFPVVGEGPRIIFEDQAFSITKDSVTIGRGEKADIQVPDPKNRISRVHAAIYRDERGQYWVRDNNSTNGTFIYADGRYKRVKKWLLHDGDTIGLSYDPSKGAHVILQFKTN